MSDNTREKKLAINRDGHGTTGIGGKLVTTDKNRLNIGQDGILTILGGENGETPIQVADIESGNVTWDADDDGDGKDKEGMHNTRGKSNQPTIKRNVLGH